MSSILSLDVSASSTGWCYTDNGIDFLCGLIKTNPKDSRSVRLLKFSTELEELLLKLKPNFIVQEDTFSGKNVKTLKILSEFAGVSKLTCMKILSLEPYIITNKTVKSYFMVPTKEELFCFMCDIFELFHLSFSKDNDIIDAKAQLLCFADEIVGLYKFRITKDYGYLYLEGIGGKEN